ncbi:MAG: N-methyl-L-tryptophan oxidase [Planctomycetaceae bacterium]|nr:N-methyl-L-tryptophan oxidase [Planctomycetaceae bacterium]
MSSYDVIVLGTGGVGSAAAFHLAHRGARVLGLDRFPGGHANGSSHGETRIIRKAYFEHADYVPLLNRAYELWHELEDRIGQQLYREVGLIEAGPPDGLVVPSVLEAARQHNLSVEEVSRTDFNDRFSAFSLPEGDVAVFEQDAGFLFVEQCVLAHLDQAKQCGAELRTGESVVAWEASHQGVSVRTESDTFHAANLVITAGAWATDLLADLDVQLTIRRKHLDWYACDDPRYRADNGCPCFFFETPAGYFYGFPQLDEQGVKFADHTGGTEIEDPLTDDKSIDPADRQRVEAFVRSYLPSVSSTHVRHEVCYYTMSPDEHFVVDRHPEHENVAFAAGLSGHGFKFASVLGEVLADLALEASTFMPIAFLGCRRASLNVKRL